MYIKIKHIKNFLLISACLFFAGFNYLTYANAEDTANSTANSCDKTVDADCDGLTNAEEKLYATDPKNIDTDGDSYSDGIEVKSGYDPTKPAPGDRIANNATASATANQVVSTATDSNAASLTDQFVEELQGYADSKDGAEVSPSEVQSFMSASVDEKLGEPMTWETLSTVDTTKIKILDQTYPNLKDSERKAKLLQDAYKYIAAMEYILRSNSPSPMITDTDLPIFAEEFKAKLYALTTNAPDVEYFANLGDRLEHAYEEMTFVEVPSTMQDLHIKFMGLLSGLLSLRNSTSLNQADPMANIVIFSKVQNLIDLSSDFFENDFQNYFKQF